LRNRLLLRLLLLLLLVMTAKIEAKNREQKWRVVE
jgi:hypothetical protein